MFAYVAHNYILLDNIKFWVVSRLKSFNPFDDIPKGTTPLFHLYCASNSVRILLCLSFTDKSWQKK